MNKLLVGTLSFLALGSLTFSGAANAADAAVSGYDNANYDWSGWYWGLKGGFADGNAEQTNLTTTARTGDISVDGGMIGTMSGYNFQSDNIVLGLDIDTAFSNIEGTTSPANVCASCSTEINWLSTVRGRAGIAMDRFLPFVTAGVAFGEVETTIPGGGNADDIFVGWTVGAGFDWAISDGWRLRFDYLYVDLGDKTQTIPVVGPVRTDVSELHVVRAGVSVDLAPIYRRIFHRG